MSHKILLLKRIVPALQGGLIILLFVSISHFQNVKEAKAIIDWARSLSGNSSAGAEVAKIINIKFFALLTLIILSALKIPAIGAGLFLNHIWILFGSSLIDIIVAVLYFVQWIFLTEAYPVGSWLGILCSVTSGVMTLMFIWFIRKEVVSDTVNVMTSMTNQSTANALTEQSITMFPLPLAVPVLNSCDTPSLSFLKSLVNLDFF